MTSRSEYCPIRIRASIAAGPALATSRSGSPPALAAPPSKASRIWEIGGALLPNDQPRLHRDQPLEEHLRLELEGEHHRGAAGHGRVAAHLQGHRRLALALRAGEHVEGPGAEAAADASSSRGNPVGQMRTSASGERSRASVRSTTAVSEVSFWSMARLDQSARADRPNRQK